MARTRLAVGHILQTERETLKFRLLAVTSVAAVVYFNQSTVELVPALILTISYAIYAILLRNLIIPRSGTVNVVYAMVLADTVTLIAGLKFVGGLESPIFTLFPLTIIYYAIYLGYPSSLFAATSVSMGYGGFVFLESSIPSPVAAVALQVPFFYLMAIFGGYLARKRLQEQAEKQELQELIRLEADARKLLEVARGVGRQLQLETVLEEMVTTGVRLTGLSRGVIALRDAASGRLVWRAANLSPRELGVRRLEEFGEPSGNGSLGEQVLQRRAPLAIAYSRKEEDYLPPWARRLGVGSLLVVPLINDRELLGVVYLFQREARHPFTEVEIQLAQGYGDIAAGIIGNALRHQEAEAKVASLASELESAVQRLERMRGARQKAVMNFDELHIDGPRGRVLLQGKPVSLSPTEFELLYALAEGAGHPLNQETLLRRVWGDDYTGQGNVVDVTIHRLRRKVEADPALPRRILTVRGAGYMLGLPPQDESVRDSR